MNGVGYKFLTADGCSLSDYYCRIAYLPAGEWHEVPGNGSYVAQSVSGLCTTGWGELLAELECDGLVSREHGQVTARRVRVLRTAEVKPEMLAAVAIRSAQDMIRDVNEPWSSEWRQWAEAWLDGTDRSQEAARIAEGRAEDISATTAADAAAETARIKNGENLATGLGPMVALATVTGNADDDARVLGYLLEEVGW